MTSDDVSAIRKSRGSRAARLAALRLAIDEGEASGKSTSFDFEKFIASKRIKPEEGQR